MAVRRFGFINGALVLVFAVGLSTPAAAFDIRPGCYERVYSASHLRSHPDQVVAALRLWVGQWFTEVSRLSMIEVVPANQGHARGSGLGGRALSTVLYCGTESRGDTCVAECDGGSLQVTRQNSGGMLFRTRYLMVGEGSCSGMMDMAEIRGQWVSYKLNKVPDSVCRGMY